MAPRVTAPEAGEGQPDAQGGQTPPDPAAVYRQLAELVRLVSPTARNLRLVYDVPGMRDPATIPLTFSAAPLSEAAVEMDAALRRVDGWVNGAALALLIDPDGDLDHTGGGFRRTVEELKSHERVETHPRKGYRAK